MFVLLFLGGGCGDSGVVCATILLGCCCCCYYSLFRGICSISFYLVHGGKETSTSTSHIVMMMIIHRSTIKVAPSTRDYFMTIAEAFVPDSSTHHHEVVA